MEAVAIAHGGLPFGQLDVPQGKGRETYRRSLRLGVSTLAHPLAEFWGFASVPWHPGAQMRYGGILGTRLGAQGHSHTGEFVAEYMRLTARLKEPLLPFPLSLFALLQFAGFIFNSSFADRARNGNAASRRTST